MTDPGRYGVVHARARVWTQVLQEALGARVDRLAPQGPGDGGSAHGFDRGVRVTSPRAGTLPLLLLERDVRDGGNGREGRDLEPLAVLGIAVDRAETVIDQWPDCGCDACDDGSDSLLAALDDSIGRVVGGPLVVLRAARWGIQWYPDGSSGYSDGTRYDDVALRRICERIAAGEDVPLPAGSQAHVGRSWLG